MCTFPRALSLSFNFPTLPFSGGSIHVDSLYMFRFKYSRSLFLSLFCSLFSNFVIVGMFVSIGLVCVAQSTLTSLFPQNEFHTFGLTISWIASPLLSLFFLRLHFFVSSHFSSIKKPFPPISLVKRYSVNLSSPSVSHGCFVSFNRYFISLLFDRLRISFTRIYHIRNFRFFDGIFAPFVHYLVPIFLVNFYGGGEKCS